MSYPVTALQLAILDVLWTHGESGVLDIHDALRGDRRVAQSTISTLLARLEERGLVTHREEERRHIYRATVARESLRRSMAAEFVEHTRPLFESDLGLLVSHLVRERGATAEEIDEARELLRRLEADGGGDPPAEDEQRGGPA